MNITIGNLNFIYFFIRFHEQSAHGFDDWRDRRGVGKSTFINALVNYLMFENIDEAAENLQCVIPTSFAIYDESDVDMKECSFGNSDENESTDTTQSCTQACRCYNIQIGKFKIIYLQ